MSRKPESTKSLVESESQPKLLFLDDMRERHEIVWEKLPDWDITSVWDAMTCMRALTVDTYDLVSLDHDLGGSPAGYAEGGSKTGQDVVAFMKTLPREKRPPRVNVHSANPVGKEHMLRDLRENGYTVFGYGTCKLLEVLRNG